MIGKNILNMNIEDNCTNTLTKLIKEKGIPPVWKVSVFIISEQKTINISEQKTINSLELLLE